MQSLEDRIKNNRTRPAEYLGMDIHVKVYSSPVLKKMLKKIEKMKADKQIAEFLSEQIVDEDGKKLLSPEFVLSEDFINCSMAELLILWQDVNAGSYSKN